VANPFPGAKSPCQPIDLIAISSKQITTPLRQHRHFGGGLLGLGWLVNSRGQLAWRSRQTATSRRWRSSSSFSDLTVPVGTPSCRPNPTEAAPSDWSYIRVPLYGVRTVECRGSMGGRCSFERTSERLYRPADLYRLDSMQTASATVSYSSVYSPPIIEYCESCNSILLLSIVVALLSIKQQLYSTTWLYIIRVVYGGNDARCVIGILGETQIRVKDRRSQL